MSLSGRWRVGHHIWAVVLAGVVVLSFAFAYLNLRLYRADLRKAFEDKVLVLAEDGAYWVAGVLTEAIGSKGGLTKQKLTLLKE